MSNRHISILPRHACLLGLLLGLSGFARIGLAQLTIPDGDPPHSAEELETLVGPIALYPDDLIGIVLPASTYPLQIVQAGRFLERRAADESLEPDTEWDNSVVALLNYPEALELLDANIDWTWALGEAVLAQQSDVIDAIQRFRERAYTSGNLESDDRQVVTHNDDVIEIAPAEPEVIYVPYYEPERVVVVQPRPAYYYYPTPYPVYYYPYPVGYQFGYHFGSPFFWGVTSVFAIGWHSHYVNVYHHRHHLHPYYAYTYHSPYYWRRGVNVNIHLDHVSHVWQPHEHPGARPHLGRGRSVASTEGYVDGRSRQTTTRSSVSRSATRPLAREDARAGAQLAQPQRRVAPNAASRLAAPSEGDARRVERSADSRSTNRVVSTRSATSPTAAVRSRESQQRGAAGSAAAAQRAVNAAQLRAAGSSVAPARGVQQSPTRNLIANQAARSPQRSVAQPSLRASAAPSSRSAPRATAAPSSRSAPSRPQVTRPSHGSTFAAPRAQSAPRAAATRSAAPRVRQAPARSSVGSPRRTR